MKGVGKPTQRNFAILPKQCTRRSTDLGKRQKNMFCPFTGCSTGKALFPKSPSLHHPHGRTRIMMSMQASRNKTDQHPEVGVTKEQQCGIKPKHLNSGQLLDAQTQTAGSSSALIDASRNMFWHVYMHARVGMKYIRRNMKPKIDQVHV